MYAICMTRHSRTNSTYILILGDCDVSIQGAELSRAGMCAARSPSWR